MYGIVYEMLYAIFQICPLTVAQALITVLLDEKYFYSFTVIHKLIFGLANALFNRS